MFVYYKNKVVLLCLFILILTVKSESDLDECHIDDSPKPLSLRLKEHILCNYDKDQPPKDDKEIHVDFMMAIHEFDYSDFGKYISIECWVAMKWTDKRLLWDLSEYENTTHVLLEANDIWTPDISVHDEKDKSNNKKILESGQCIVGGHIFPLFEYEVICIMSTTLYSHCTPDLRHWPFDVHNCTMQIKPTKLEKNKVFINRTIINVVRYLFENNTEWNLYDVKMHADKTLNAIVGYLVVHRHSVSFVVVSVIPVVVTMVVTVLSLWLDPKLSERMYLIGLSVISHYMCLKSLIWQIPTAYYGDKVPYILEVISASLLLTLIIPFETMFVRYLSMKIDSPDWLVLSLSVLANSKPGQIILFSELNPEGATTNITADDSSNLVESTTAKRLKEWYLFAKLLDKLIFVIYVLTYFTMIMKFVA